MSTEYKKLGQVWKLPATAVIVQDLRTAGGSPLKLALAVTDSADAESLIFAISELLSQPGNADHLAQWNKLCDLGRSAAVQIGSDRLLQRYSMGDIPKNATFLYRLVSDVRDTALTCTGATKVESLNEGELMLAGMLCSSDPSEPLSSEDRVLLVRYEAYLRSGNTNRLEPTASAERVKEVLLEGKVK